MKLEKQFLKLYHKFTVSDEWEGSLEADASKIAEDFAVGFEEFKEKYNNSHRIHKQGKELLEIYKQTL